MKVATIMGDGIYLRPLEMSDAKIINENIYTKENTEYMLFRKEQTFEETIEFLGEVLAQYKKLFPKFLEFGIVYNRTLVGLVSLSRVKHEFKTYEIGWIIDKEYSRRGITSSAVESVIDYCKRCGVKKLIAHSDIKNEASIGLILKLGMTNTNLVSVRNYADGTKSYENQYELKL